MGKPALVLSLSDEQRSVLEEHLRSKSLPAREVERARIVLLAAKGLSAEAIAEHVGCGRGTVLLWRSRFAHEGFDALTDKARTGRPRSLPRGIEERIIAKTLQPPPKRLGITHWSSRLLARELGVSHETVARVWRAHGLKPHRHQTFQFSTDPELEDKIEDIIGLYLNPPENAIVLLLRPGLPERATHDYKRNGTASLFAALEIATGRVTDRTFERHRHQEFLAFLKLVAKTHPRGELHIVLDNYGTHKHPAVQSWLERRPRIQLHFTPTDSSWLYLVETFFSIITKQAIRRGSFGSVKDLIQTIRRFIDAWNDRCEPFVWTKDAASVIAKVKRSTESLTVH